MRLLQRALESITGNQKREVRADPPRREVSALTMVCVPSGPRAKARENTGSSAERKADGKPVGQLIKIDIDSQEGGFALFGRESETDGTPDGMFEGFPQNQCVGCSDARSEVNAL